MVEYKDYENFIATRLYQLRNQKDVSAREMSLAIGQHKGYITQIENGQSDPSIQGLYYICEYFGITPEEYFAEDNRNPEKIRRIVDKLKRLSDNQLNTVDDIVSAFEIKNEHHD